MKTYTNNEAQFELLTKIIDQIETIRAIDKPSFDRLQSEYSQLQKEPSNNQVMLLTSLALSNTQFRKTTETQYQKLDKNAVELYKLRSIQTKLKEATPLSRASLNLDPSYDVVTRLKSKLADQMRKHSHPIVERIKKDFEIFYRTFTPSTQIFRHTNTITEKTFDIKQFDQTPPDAILLMGNNDLIQVDYIASLYHRLPPEKRPVIYVSGYGGHGVTHGHIFGLSEAESMIQRLQDCGVPADQIIYETDAVDTGKNVSKIETMMLVEKKVAAEKLKMSDSTSNSLLELKHALQNRTITANQQALLHKQLAPFEAEFVAQKTALHKNILISGSPALFLRQLRTYEKQARLPWDSISTIAPPLDWIYKHYFSNEHNALINFIYALREIATYMTYTINTSFLPSRMIDDTNNLKLSIQLCVDYYNLLTNDRIDGQQLANQFVEYSRYQSKAQTSHCEKLHPSINVHITKMASYFRQAFLWAEHIWMKTLPNTLTASTQAEKLDSTGTYGRYGLIPFSLFKHAKNEAPVDVGKSFKCVPY